MSKPKGTISKKVEKKVREYFLKKANDIKPDTNTIRTDSPKP